jgi:hypothetical protein
MARNWTQDQDAYQRRMGNSSGAMRELAARVNHLGAFCPRISFAQHVREADIEPYGSSPSTFMTTRDFIVPPNAQTFIVRALALPRIYDPGTSALMRVAETTYLPFSLFTEDSTLANVRSPTPRWPEDLLFSQMEVSRFDTYSPRQRVIVTVAGYTIVDIAIQDKSVPTLNTSQHAAVRGDLAAAGRDGLWDMPEDIRYAFERLRTGNLPVMFQWHAIGTPAGWATETDFGVGSPNGDQRGIWVTSAGAEPDAPTRFYFAATDTGVYPPANGTWDVGTAHAGSLVTAVTNTSFETFGVSGLYDQTNQYILLFELISAPLAVQTISGTVKSQVRAKATGDYVDMARAAIEIFVTDNEGTTVRGTLLAKGSYVATDMYDISERNKTYADADTLSEVTTQSGDRIVVKIGAYVTCGSGPEWTEPLLWSMMAVYNRLGDPNSTNDMPENETETSDLLPWVEFSQTLVFS